MKDTALQRKAFAQYEANQWYARNKQAVDNYSGEDDIVVRLLKQYHIQPLRVLEIGCSAGYRLNYLKEYYPEARVIGIDPSSDAVKRGSDLYPNIELFVGTADDLSQFENGYFDLIIVGFVFYVIDRTLLLKVISEIDRVLSDKGFLVNTDFYSEKPLKNKYHHITEFEAYSFKQNYESIFLASEMYQLIHKSSFHHSARSFDASDDYFNKCTATLLKKDVYAVY
jgi:ubiquinone/menaquinone biosynthesis C-methylase UbiE